ncbi:MAG: DUF664 domain-containing protein [Streptosporangiaceae bacterium]
MGSVPRPPYPMPQADRKHPTHRLVSAYMRMVKTGSCIHAALPATYATEVAMAKAVGAGRSLDETFPEKDSIMNLRWVYLHVLEEYTRHNGHAGLIREAIDGAIGH